MLRNIKDIQIDVKTLSVFAGGFVLGNIYGTVTTLKAAKKNIMLVKGYVIK